MLLKVNFARRIRKNNMGGVRRRSREVQSKIGRLRQSRRRVKKYAAGTRQPWLEIHAGLTLKEFSAPLFKHSHDVWYEFGCRLLNGRDQGGKATNRHGPYFLASSAYEFDVLERGSRGLPNHDSRALSLALIENDRVVAIIYMLFQQFFGAA